MKTNSTSNHGNLWTLTVLGFSAGLLIGILLIHYNILPEEVDAQVYVAFSLIFGGLAFLLANRNSRTSIE